MPSEIKIEIFYGDDMPHATIMTDPDTELFEIPMDRSIPIYGREELIGSKMTTLPLQTIGIGVPQPGGALGGSGTRLGERRTQMRRNKAEY